MVTYLEREKRELRSILNLKGGNNVLQTKDGRPRSSKQKRGVTMDFNYEASLYMTKISTAVLALGNMSGCDLDTERMRKVLISMLELEQSTADFITVMKINAAGSKICKESFIHANNTEICHLQKIQSHGNDFNEYITALKLENDTLKEELDSL